jgi:hypothetical protein
MISVRRPHFLALFALFALLGWGLAGHQLLERRASAARVEAERVRLAARIEDLEAATVRRYRDEADHLGGLHAAQVDVASAQLEEIRTAILEARAELDQLASDRAAATALADDALHDLRERVRSVTEIEHDLARLARERGLLMEDARQSQQQVDQATLQVEQRLSLADHLEQRIAYLALQQETMQAQLELIETAEVSTTLAAAASGVDAATLLEGGETAPDPAASEAVPPLPLEEEDQDRSRGLYRFSHLDVDGAVEDKKSTVAALIPAARNDPPEASNRASAVWAEEQYLLGLTLMARGEQSTGTTELADAVLAFRAALSEWTAASDDEPLRRAIAQNDLGYALALLGQRQSNVALLEEAAAACRGAMAEFARDETPLLWAAAQHSLGVSLAGLAEVDQDREFWRRAANAFQLALEVFQAEGAASEIQQVQRRLEDAHRQLQIAAKGS